MPPKPDPPNQGTKKHKFGIFRNKNAKDSASESSSTHAAPSTSDVTINAQSAIRNARLAIEGLKTASDMSDVLRPLKLVCFALTLIVDTAEVGIQCVSKVLLIFIEYTGRRKE
jgi:hypothetical protein